MLAPVCSCRVTFSGTGAGIFTLELLVNIIAEWFWKFFFGEQKYWNVFDLVVVSWSITAGCVASSSNANTLYLCATLAILVVSSSPGVSWQVGSPVEVSNTNACSTRCMVRGNGSSWDKRVRWYWFASEWCWLC